jgi:hypothetical protein
MGPAGQQRDGDDRAAETATAEDAIAVAARERSYSWEDPGAAAARSMSGKEFFAGLVSGQLPSPPIAVTLGFTAASACDGVARFELDTAEFHYNPIGSVHGGVIATLCDSACGCAVHSLLPAGIRARTEPITPCAARLAGLTCRGERGLGCGGSPQSRGLGP